ncbi:hypothetical protein [Demequina litoralis]|uniref:hypothetical protein n=1 Tax=Demequina litoralis TaxID=3051660 RepID=UPI003F555FF2
MIGLGHGKHPSSTDRDPWRSESTDAGADPIAETIATVTGFHGTTEWDTTKPDGTPQKLLDVSHLAGLGWTAQITLEEGLRCTYAWYLDNAAHIRG